MQFVSFYGKPTFGVSNGTMTIAEFCREDELIKVKDMTNDHCERVRASSVHDHFGTYHFGTGFSPNSKFGPLRYM